MTRTTEPAAVTAKPFKAAGLPTLIGSLPLESHQEALDWIFAHTPEIPLWPQLPSRRDESMLRQFIEGFPGVSEVNGRTILSSGTEDFETGLLAFYEAYLAAAENPAELPGSSFAVSRSRAAGLYALKEEMKKRSGAVAVKGQITGPFTLLVGLTDQDKRLAYYDPAVREMAVKGLAMKAAWQVRYLRDLDLPVLLFIDEPALAGLGSSSYISIALDDIRQDLTEVITAIKLAGGLAGIHVCANTDWDFLLSLDLDILSFDAFGYFDRLLASREKIHRFLDRGGIIAWGGVPTSRAEDIRAATAESLASLWESQAGMLANPQWDLPALLGQHLITPSCGTGSLAPGLARQVLALTREVAGILRARYGLHNP